MRKAIWTNLYHFDTMAMRPRGGGTGSRRGTRTGVVRPVYEDFKPVSEWQQEDDESHLLNIYLPLVLVGFMKEQIKITTEGWNTIRVRGERLVAGNKWSRFSEDFQVPENGEMNSVRTKFHGGILTVSVPKEVPQDALPPQNRDIDDIQKQPPPQKPGREATSEVKGHDEIRKQPKTQKSKAKAVQEVDQQSFLPARASTEPNNERDLDDDRRGRNFTPSRSTGNEEESSENQRGRSFTPTRNVIAQNVEKKDVALEKPEDTTKENLHKESREAIGGPKLPAVETTNTKESEKSGAIGIPEKIANKKDSNRALKQQNYKKALRGLTELNEERQLLVNMGVAVLVIVALTAYVTHSFASAKHEN